MKDTEKLYGRAMLDEDTIALDTAGDSVSIRKKASPCVVDPLAAHILLSVSVAKKDGWHHAGERRGDTLSSIKWSLRLGGCDDYESSCGGSKQGNHHRGR